MGIADSRAQEEWWKTAVFYQIYPRSFLDSNGDGIGDLEGIRQRLDYLVDLGVDVLWISPFYPSPMKDFGYDVANYCDVDPIFGNLDDFDRLLAEAHDRGLRIIVDWVPNHTSDQHPWFVESRSSRSNPKRDWYIWRDGKPNGEPPNNWRAAFTEHLPLNGYVPANSGELPGRREVDDASVWTFDETTQQYFLHMFLPEQPDVNWRNPELVEAMHSVLSFWLDRGVDGFRIDVLHCIVKDAALADMAPKDTIVPLTDVNDQPDTHEAIRGLRKLLDSYPGIHVMVGEIFLKDTAKVAKYYGSGDEVNLAFNFPPLFTPWDVVQWNHRIDEVEQFVDPTGGWPTWVLSNHDNSRHRTRYGGSEARARAAAVLLLTLRGTPFIFEGEELGLEDARIPAHLQVDPGGRDGSRAPIPWDASPAHGWPAATNWLPFPPHPETNNAAAEFDDPDSVFYLYQSLLDLRRASKALQVGTLNRLFLNEQVMAYTRQCDDDERVVMVNFSSVEQSVALTGDWLIDLSSRSGATRPFAGLIGADEAVILRSL